MQLFCFASKNLENIARGIEAKLWAVATVSESAMKARVTKARRYFSAGSLGLIYCTETQSFTTPFITTSKADPIKTIVDVWPEPWVLPFSINPLGDLSKQLHMTKAKAVWPLLKNCGSGGVTANMNITGATVFSPLEITEKDWDLILKGLAI